MHAVRLKQWCVGGDERRAECAHLQLHPAPSLTKLPGTAALQVRMKPGKPLTFAKVSIPEQNRQAEPAACHQ